MAGPGTQEPTAVICPCILHPYRITITACATKKAWTRSTATPQKAQVQIKSIDTHVCCCSKSLDPLGSLQGPPVIGVGLICSVPAPIPCILAAGQFREATHCPNAAKPPNRDLPRRIEVKLSTHPHSLSWDLGLWGNSVDLPFWKSVAHGPLVPQLQKGH